MQKSFIFQTNEERTPDFLAPRTERELHATIRVSWHNVTNGRVRKRKIIVSCSKQRPGVCLFVRKNTLCLPKDRVEHLYQENSVCALHCTPLVCWRVSWFLGCLKVLGSIPSACRASQMLFVVITHLFSASTPVMGVEVRLKHRFWTSAGSCAKQIHRFFSTCR